MATSAPRGASSGTSRLVHRAICRTSSAVTELDAWIQSGPRYAVRQVLFSMRLPACTIAHAQAARTDSAG